MSFPWTAGYEWELPNELDRAFDRAFKNSRRGENITVTCRSPWIRLDMDRRPDQYKNGPTVGVNLSLLTLPCDYCVSGGDPEFWRHVRPSEHPRVCIVLSGSQNNLEFGQVNKWGNVHFYTAPGVLPPGLQKHQRQLPRPFEYDNSGCVALWLAWYMGASNIFLAGAHFRLCENTIHGDSPELDQPGEKALNYYRQTLPIAREKTAALVAAIRDDGVTVDWPGEAP